jgi:hypothetical protein
MARGELNLRHRRSADQSENSTPNEAENYYYWGKGADSYCKFHEIIKLYPKVLNKVLIKLV